ncbi:hypothetical protein [Actinopolymorpha alba]|nr:hypothetical protein [Actinopolymorpha alba]
MPGDGAQVDESHKAAASQVPKPRDDRTPTAEEIGAVVDQVVADVSAG